MSFPAISIGGHLSVSVGDRLVRGVWRRAPSGEQASKPLSDSRQQPFCNFVSKVVRGAGKGPEQTVEMGTKRQNSRLSPQTGEMAGRRIDRVARPEPRRRARHFPRASASECRFHPGSCRSRSRISVFSDGQRRDSSPHCPLQPGIRQRRAIRFDRSARESGWSGVCGADASAPISSIRLGGDHLGGIGSSADRQRVPLYGALYIEGWQGRRDLRLSRPPALQFAAVRTRYSRASPPPRPRCGRYDI